MQLIGERRGTTGLEMLLSEWKRVVMFRRRLRRRLVWLAGLGCEARDLGPLLLQGKRG